MKKLLISALEFALLVTLVVLAAWLITGVTPRGLWDTILIHAN